MAACQLYCLPIARACNSSVLYSHFRFPTVMEADESSLLSISDPNFDVNIAYEKDTTEISQVGCLLFTPISNDHCFQLFEGEACQSLSAVGLGSGQTDPDDTTPHPSPSPVHRPEPEARFDVKVTTGKFGKMKGKERRQVTLVLGNNVFRYRSTLDSGKLVFSCRE